jgi:hypothetical protein
MGLTGPEKTDPSKYATATFGRFLLYRELYIEYYTQKIYTSFYNILHYTQIHDALHDEIPYTDYT